MNIHEENFIHYLKQRDERALDYVVDAYGGLVKSVTYKVLYDVPHLQEECMNDVLLAVWQHIDDFRPEKSSFKNWIAAIAKYKSIDHKRKYSRQPQSEGESSWEEGESIGVEDEIFSNQLSEELEELLTHLSPEDRELFMEHYLGDRAISELSEVRGVNRAVIDNRLSRGRKKLKSIWENRRER